MTDVDHRAGEEEQRMRPELRKLSIALIGLTHPGRGTSLNKELNGGLGTADDFGGSLATRLIRSLKKRGVRMPVLSYAYLQAILKQQGHAVSYFEENTLDNDCSDFDLILLYGSIVDYKYENAFAGELRTRFPEAKVGFFGPFPTVCPDLFANADFVLLGEAEAFFLDHFFDPDQLDGHVPVPDKADWDSIPTPDFEGFPVQTYRYAPGLPGAPFVPLQGSKGCPYSCKYYCTYGEFQGPKVRQRSASKLVQDIERLQSKHGITTIQFRDPVFGLKPGFIHEFCDELRTKNIQLTWGIETRIDLLDEESIKEMVAVGLANLNVGIETNVPAVASINKRKLISEDHQEHILGLCKRMGVSVAAFYVLGMESDTPDTVESTIQYAIKLNTFLARFSVATPYPGTAFFEDITRQDRLLTRDYEQYTQFNLVFKHPHFSREVMRNVVGRAYGRYYFRAEYVAMAARHTLRRQWL